MRTHDCREPAPLTQGWYRYTVRIAARDAGGYEWHVFREPDSDQLPADPRVTALAPISRGTAANCADAQRRSEAARHTLMSQHAAADGIWPGMATARSRDAAK